MRSLSVIVAVLVAIAGLGLAGCGEKPQELAQKDRSYRGKPDARPWDSPQWGGEQANWERAIEARTQNQNEYTRTQ